MSYTIMSMYFHLYVLINYYFVTSSAFRPGVMISWKEFSYILKLNNEQI
jgi:hypothetical protein